MSGSTDSETHDRTTQDRETRDGGAEGPETRTPATRDRSEQDQDTQGPEDSESAESAESAEGPESPKNPEDPEDHDPAEPDDEARGDEDEDQDPEVRRARWTAVATGALLTVAGLAASVMRTGGSGTALIPLSYASGAVLCAGASALGARGRTRRALWLMIAGVMVMAVGDQLD
ncbi:hypothetical protein [Streptomyces sp. NPDC058751]|uniref:hypothetical protein n=1 Tax=Streptomyces sp. NPDC058751 TaxID=3346623 RepID=UPI0036AD8FF5